MRIEVSGKFYVILYNIYYHSTIKSCTRISEGIEHTHLKICHVSKIWFIQRKLAMLQFAYIAVLVVIGHVADVTKRKDV